MGSPAPHKETSGLRKEVGFPIVQSTPAVLSLLPQLAWKGSGDQGTIKPTSTGGETCGRKKGHATGFDLDQSIPFQWLLVENSLKPEVNGLDSTCISRLEAMGKSQKHESAIS